MGGAFIVIMLVFGVIRFITGKPDKVTHTEKTIAAAEYEALKEENSKLKSELIELKLKYQTIQESLQEAEVESDQLREELAQKAAVLDKDLVDATDTKPVKVVTGNADDVANQIALILN